MKPSSALPIAFIAFFVLIFACQSEQNKEANSESLLGSGFGLCATTFVVENIDTARNYFADVLGFDVPKSEGYQNGIYDSTVSASIYFSDISSLELLAIKDSVVQVPKSFLTSYLKKHEGARMYSLSTSSAQNTQQWISSNGIKMDSVQSGRVTTKLPKGWDWDDGGPEWRSADFNFKNPPAYLPNFVEYVGFNYEIFKSEWKSIHGSIRQYYKHPNGVIGISALRIAVTNIKDASKEFAKMGLVKIEDDKSPNIVKYKISDHQELHLIASEKSDDDVAKFLKTRGQGIFAIRFEVKNLDSTEVYFQGKLPSTALSCDSLPNRLIVSQAFAKGVQFEFVEESKEQAELAKIYSFSSENKLDSVSKDFASSLYVKYCALCHGANREGYAADHAPSLRSHSLMATTHSTNYLKHAVNYGRNETAMAAYGKSQGGPLEEVEVELLLKWLYELSGVKKPIELSTESINGDIALGKTLYGENCAVCHGLKGEGVSAPALGKPMLLATASDAFLRYAITEGRDSTPMVAFKDRLSKVEIDALTAFLRSRASGWNAPDAVTFTEPLPKDYVLNPRHKSPKFNLREGLYVSSEQLNKSLQDSARMVILDARSKAAWHQTHIPGTISVPYYAEPDCFIENIPNDSTMIVVYCACPHAASQKVVNTLKRFGYKNTAILDEGILVWTNLGYPVQYGHVNKEEKTKGTKSKK